MVHFVAIEFQYVPRQERKEREKNNTPEAVAKRQAEEAAERIAAFKKNVPWQVAGWFPLDVGCGRFRFESLKEKLATKASM